MMKVYEGNFGSLFHSAGPASENAQKFFKRPCDNKISLRWRS